MIYSVRYTDQVRNAILEQARYIAVERWPPLNAERWLERIWDGIDSLERWPRRCSFALENEFRPFEIRNINVDGYLSIYTIDDDARIVWGIGFRHACQDPQPDELPDEAPPE